MKRIQFHRMKRHLFLIVAGAMLVEVASACAAGSTAPTAPPTTAPSPSQTATPARVAPAVEGIVSQSQWMGIEVYPLQSGDTFQVMTVFQGSVLPVLTEQPGFQGWLLMADTAATMTLLQTLWASQADLEAAETNGELERALAALADLATGSPDTSRYQVSVAVEGTAQDVWMRTERMRFSADNLDKAINLYRESVLPVLRAQIEFDRAYLLTAADTGEAIAQSLWGSPAAMYAAGDSAELQEQMARLRELAIAEEGITQEMWASTNIKR